LPFQGNPVFIKKHKRSLSQLEYRQLLKGNEKISLLGFGFMRLPVIENNPADIDEKKAFEIYVP